ncbi:MAG TPA: hypothetical protein VGE39_06225, partial [Prosthecobacter sp.]
TGRVSSVDGLQVKLPVTVALAAAVPHYLEVLEGALAGQVFDIGADLKLSSSLPLAGVRVSIRPHWTLGGLLPASSFDAGADAASADRALTFDSATNGFQTHVLADENATARVMAPHEGVFVQLRSQATTVVLLGEARTSPLAQPQSAGTRFLGSGVAVPLAPGSQTHAAGSRLRLWSGDADAASAAYRNYLLNEQSRWVDEATGTDITTEPVLDGFRAYFLVRP